MQATEEKSFLGPARAPNFDFSAFEKKRGRPSRRRARGDTAKSRAELRGFVRRALARSPQSGRSLVEGKIRYGRCKTRSLHPGHRQHTIRTARGYGYAVPDERGCERLSRMPGPSRPAIDASPDRYSTAIPHLMLATLFAKHSVQPHLLPWPPGLVLRTARRWSCSPGYLSKSGTAERVLVRRRREPLTWHLAGVKGRSARSLSVWACNIHELPYGATIHGYYAMLAVTIHGRARRLRRRIWRNCRAHGATTPARHPRCRI